MKRLRSSIVLVLAALLGAACGGGDGSGTSRPPPSPVSPFRCFRPSSLPRTETAKVSCFNPGGCATTLITSMSTPPNEVGYTSRPFLTSASRFMTVHSGGFSNVTIPRGLNHDISLTLEPGFSTPAGVQQVLVEAISGDSVVTLLDVTLVPSTNLCP
ncbi:MAG TPA: hypothetical protein VK698_04255 [Kofleriaceae bacterium]|nr:hypothetical protein [Kofleriaceae bacterium]